MCRRPVTADCQVPWGVSETVHVVPETARRTPVEVGTDIALAAARLARGGVVGMPTETVYGLAADAENPDAVARVYAVKGRPLGHPLIVHVAEASAVTGDGAQWAREVPDHARRLMEAFWPGPLTVILPRGQRAGALVTGGGDTVGLRCPAHPVATAVLHALAEATGRPGAGLAAPSANRFGRVSPTRAGDVLAELGDLLDGERDYILDGGSSRVGVESTILDCTGPAPAVLRPGAISPAEVVRIGGRPLADRAQPGVRAPGTLAAHYAPRATVVLMEAAVLATAGRVAGPAPRPGRRTGLLAPAHLPTPDGVVRLAAPPDVADYARVLYTALREADVLALDQVIAVAPEGEEPLVAAVRDRLRRAAAGSR